MSSSLVCKHCGCSDIDRDPARGDAVCTQCGSVLEDQLIVSEVQFAENSAGGASIIGQFVSADGPKSMGGLAGAFHHGMGKESRQITLQNGKTRIQKLGAQLKLNQHCIETAFNFYKMAVTRRFTRGRRINHCIAACVYIVCRTEGTPHMLLDFSDVLQIDVYTLGRTYLQLSKELCITIPALDPCLYIHRFAHKLEFEDKTHDVSMTALRLVQRMKRDWMAQGRRPSGLCGAALLVASRVHDFSRHIKDIIRVVKIGEGTIRKRLAEFEATPSSQLTVDEFQKIDLEEEMDPPCYTEGKRKAKLQQLEDGHLSTLTSEVSELQKEIDFAIDDANKKKFARYKKYMSVDTPQTGDTGSEGTLSRVSSPLPLLSDSPTEDVSAVNTFIISETLKDIVSGDDLGNTNTESSEVVLTDEIADKIHLLDSNIQSSSTVDDCTKQKTLDFTNDKNSVFENNIKSGLIPRPSVESLGITNSIEDYMKDTTEEQTGKMMETEEDCELDLSGIDDDEIDMFLLNDDEVKIKTFLWTKANADYLKELKEKQERLAREKEEAEKNPDAKKKKKPRRKQTKVEHSTAADAIKMMLQEKKISSKINYDVLKGLNKPPEPPVEDAGPVLGAGPIEATPVTIGRFKRPSDLKSEVDNPKKLKQEPVTVKKEVKREVIVESGPVIVESGPIQYDEQEHEEAEEDYEEEEEDEEHVSAAALMGHGAGEEDYYGHDGYDDD